MHRRNRPTGFFKNSNYRAKTTQPNDANYLERSKDNEYFETVDLDVPKHPLTLKNIKGYYIFKNPSRNNNLQRRPYYGNFLYDCEKICLTEDLTVNDLNLQGNDSLEKFSNLSEQRKKNILIDHQIFCVSLLKSCAWQFMTYEIQNVCFSVHGFNCYSHEEIRLGFYLSYGNKDLFIKYMSYMDMYNEEYKNNVNILLSTDFFSLLKYDSLEWSNPSNRFDHILSYYQQGFNKNCSLIFELDKIASMSCNVGLDNKKKINQWYTLPVYPISHEFQLGVDDEILKKPLKCDFPTHKHFFSENFPLFSDILISQIGPDFYQHNSSTTSFDGAYSYDTNFCEEEALMYSEDNYSPGRMPLFPPTRKMVLESLKVVK